MNRKQRRAGKKPRPAQKAGSLQNCVDAVIRRSADGVPDGCALVVLGLKGGPGGQVALASTATRDAAIAALRFVADRLEEGVPLATASLDERGDAN